MEDNNNLIFSLNNIKLEEINKNNTNYSNIRKIIIVADWLKTSIMLEPYTFAENLKEYGWELFELSNVDVNEIKKEKSIILCITYDSFDISNLKNENTTIIYKLDDLYPYKEIRNICINKADLLIGAYKHLFHKVNYMYDSITNVPSFCIPFTAVNHFYENIKFNNNPKNKILISGYRANTYPFRIKLYDMSLEDNYKNKLETLQHPNYDNCTHNIINENYYKKLNEYMCCFTDALIYDYIVLKVFEITSVGSLLLVVDSISDELNKLGFYDNVNCIMCNENNIYEKINWILHEDNLNTVNSIRYKGMEMTRKNHNTKKRAYDFNNLLLYTITDKKNNLEKLEKQLINTERKETFENIYKKKIWTNGDMSIPLSGPGSSLIYTGEISNMLNEFIYNNGIKNILDLGYGDLTWISNTPFFKDNSIEYTGIEIVNFLVEEHKIKYPERNFYNGDIINYKFNFASLIIIHDVIHHLKNDEILELFNNIKNKFQYIAITSSITSQNTDNFNEYYFSLKNINIEPFNIKCNYLQKIFEPAFNRFFYIYSHDNFFEE